MYFGRNDSCGGRNIMTRLKDCVTVTLTRYGNTFGNAVYQLCRLAVNLDIR